MHPSSAEMQVDVPLARPSAQDTRQYPLGLGFVDRSLERAWWRQYARDRLRILRGNIALLYISSFFFWPVDVFVFREHTRELLTARFLMMVAFAVPTPLIFGKRSDEALERHAQELLLYLTGVGLAALFPMAWFVLDTTNPQLTLMALSSALFTLVCIYCTSGLRFAYAAPVGGLGALVFFTMVRVRSHPSRELTLTTIAFLAGESLVCAVICYSLESMGRRDFLRRRELEEAHARTETLLLNLMPPSLAKRLKSGQGTALDRLPEATILFGTLLGFDEATRNLPPLDAVRLLDRIVARFDRLARAHGVERIKTVGATYMAAAGVPEPLSDHAERGARLALAMREMVRGMAKEQDLPISLRVGVASGPVVAGVIGKTRIAFDCWGDTANFASRLDSHGVSDRIQLAPDSARRLAGGFVVTERGTIAIKGKGDVLVSLLEGER